MERLQVRDSQAAENQREEEAPDLVLTSFVTQQKRAAGLKILDIGFYAEQSNQNEIRFSDIVRPAQFLLAGIAALTQQEVESLKEMEEHLYRVRNARALAPFEMMIHLLADRARSEARITASA